MALDNYSRGQRFALGGVLVGGVGAFLPWIEASAFGFSRSITGVQGGDGYVVLIAAGVLALTVVVGEWGRKSRILGGLAITVVGLMYAPIPPSASSSIRRNSGRWPGRC